jgi:tetratricopeptide (TPR) repeat protein
MAIGRLNRRVAFFGFAVIAILLLGIIAAVLHEGRNPQEYIRDAEISIEAARTATEEEVKGQSYKEAGRSFHNAYDRAETNALREEILLKMLDMYVETNQWNFILGCWEELLKVNPANAQARYGRVQYFYVLADSGDPRYWPQVQKEASKFLEIGEDANLLGQDKSEYQIPGMEADVTGPRKLVAYLYFVRGRAAFEMARLGSVTDKEESLDRAVVDLEKARELEPESFDPHLFLGRVAVTRGDIFASRGSADERDKAARRGLALTEQAVQVAGDSPTAYISLLSLKLALAGGIGADAMKDRLETIEPEYLALLERFGSSAEAFAAASDFYRLYSIYSGSRLGAGHLDRAIETAERAVALDNENVPYAIDLANLYYRRFSVYQSEPDIDKAIETAKAALALPAAQEVAGPRRQANRSNRYNLFSLLAKCYIERVLDAGEQNADSEIRAWMNGAERAVHEIEQLVGSSEDPRAVTCHGMLDLAKGNKHEAVARLYDAYVQLKAVKPAGPPWPPDPEFARLAYTLAGIFEDTVEIGAVREFLTSALLSRIDWVKPQASLDYAEVLFRFGHFNDALENINAFEENSGSNERSRKLRIRAYIGARQFADAERELARLDAGEYDTIRLRLSLTQAKIRDAQLAEAQKTTQDNSSAAAVRKVPVVDAMTEQLKELTRREAELLEKLLAEGLSRNKQAVVTSACRRYIAQDQMELARNLLDRFLERYPDNTAAFVYDKMLSEPDPRDVPDSRLREIEEQALSEIADPVQRSVQFGIHHRRYEEPDKALEYLKQALEPLLSQGELPEGSEKERMELAANHLLDIAIGAEDWQLAEEVVQAARQGNLDDCEGRVFATRLAMTRGKYEDALTRIDKCLKQKPIFSFGYLLRSNIDLAMGNEHAAVEDIRRAASLNPLDGNIARALASLLYTRNQQLGNNISAAQIAETRDALEKAVALNPNDLSLLGLYADYISDAEPLRAIAIRQDLQKADPSLENAVLLGRLALRVAESRTGQQGKEAMLAIAESAFQQARRIDPGDRQMLYYYAEYLRARGRAGEAARLLEQSRDEQLLWSHYYRAGQYENARRVLKQLYEKDDTDVEVLKGLLLVAEKTLDTEGVKKYSEQLVRVADTLENRLAQVGAYLRVGLIRQAEHATQSVKEKYPDEPRLLLIRSWLLMRQGKLDKALELANRNLQSDSENPIAWRLKGEINFFRGNYDQAIRDLGKSKVLFDTPATRVSLAKAYLRMERHEEAITELKMAIDSPGAAVEARLLLEQIYRRLDRNSALAEFYQETLGKFPNSAGWLNRAGAFAVKTGDFDKAEKLYSNALNIRGKMRASSDNGQGEQGAPYAEALDCYLNVLIAAAGEPGSKGWNPDKLNKVSEEAGKYTNSALAPIAYFRMGQAKSVLGEESEAGEFFRTAVDKAADNGHLAAEILKKMYVLLGRQEVLGYCRQKLDENPQSIGANFTMYSLSRISGEYEAAIDYIDRCIELAEPNPQRKAAYAIEKGNMLIRAYVETSDKKYLKAAVSDYESLLAKMPKSITVAVVLNNLAYVLAENDQRLSDALEYSERALEAKPNDPGFLGTYAYVLLKNGKVSEAGETLTAALQQYQQSENDVPPELYEHKGMMKEKLGARTEALVAYKQALEAGGETLSPGTRERIERAVERVSP